MATAYSGSEAVEIAIQIEVCGAAYYKEAIEHLESERLRDVFRFLHDEEKRHQKDFEQILSTLTDTGAEWRQSEEYATYMRALAEDRVFPTPEAARELVRGLGSDREAVRTALRFEKDTILFFYELRQAVREQDRAVVDRLIEEEQKHVRRLSGLLQGLESTGGAK